MRALFLRENDARANYREILEQTGARPDHVVYLDHPYWDEMLVHGRDMTNTPARCADVTNIQYTSGTTGSPKGVLLTHHNIVNNAWLFAERFRLEPHCLDCAAVRSPLEINSLGRNIAALTRRSDH